ncbi:MAG: FCD domain-containing protein [Veillonella sp.]
MLVEIGDHMENKNMESVVAADVEFHEVPHTAHLVTNDWRTSFTTCENKPIDLRSFSMNQPGRLRKTWEEHRQLVEAIASLTMPLKLVS